MKQAVRYEYPRCRILLNLPFGLFIAKRVRIREGEDSWSWWNTKSFLGITRNGWVWILLWTILILWLVFGVHWDHAFGRRP